MAKKYTAEAKTAAIREMLEKKRPVTHIARDLGISKSRLYAWSEQARHIKTNEPLTPRKIHDLQVALRRAEQKLEVYAIAQYANCGTRHEKLEEIESILKRYGKHYSRHLVCEVFGVNRTTLVNHLHRGKRDAAWWVLHRRELAELVMGVFAEFNSCCGAAMSSDSFRRLLVRLGVNQSFSRPRNPRDNAVIESFNNTMKREDFRIRNYSSLASFKQGFAKFIEFYNERRPHKFNKYLTPSEKEAKCPQVGGS